MKTIAPSRRRRRLLLVAAYCAASSLGLVDGFRLLQRSRAPMSLLRRRQLRQFSHGTLSPLEDDAKEDDFATINTNVVVIDRAPCFDNGACLVDDVVISTDTVDNDDDDARNGGGAIHRLGPNTGPTVWSEFGRIGAEQKSLHDHFANLGQGFPDWSPPPFCIKALVDAATDPNSSSQHQYTRTAGHPALVKELASRYTKHMGNTLGRTIDPMAEVAVTVGASQALYLCLQTLVTPEVCNEVILFEPYFDLYDNQIRLAGGIPVYVPLTFVAPSSMTTGSGGGGGGGRWILESDELRDKVSKTKTCAIILNSPHNPTGKVFTREEMLDISRIVLNDAGPQCVVISDEVYKYIVHSPPVEEDDDVATTPAAATTAAATTTTTSPGHVHFASLPQMYDRTITVSSAGKTFSATGWQVGWCIGPPRLISNIHRLLPYVQFCASTVMQEALARTLPLADEPYMGFGNYYDYLNDMYRKKRDMLALALHDAGFDVPDYNNDPGWGGFFIYARITPRVKSVLPPHRLELPFAANPAAPGGVARLDWALCQWMAEEKGVLCIPSSPFYSKERALEGVSDEFIRVAFCKTDETIERAAVALRGLTSSLLVG